MHLSFMFGRLTCMDETWLADELGQYNANGKQERIQIEGRRAVQRGELSCDPTEGRDHHD